jgi:hypothetical protein
MPAGKTIEFNFLQLEKALAPIFFIPSGKTIETKDVHSAQI